MINYHNKTFHSIGGANRQHASPPFHVQFKQIDNLIIAEFSDHHIPYGQLLGQYTEYGVLKTHYHQVDQEGNMDYGLCQIYPQQASTDGFTIRMEWVSLADREKRWELIAIASISSSQ